MSKLKIAVDFDGTLCLHRYPEIGPELEKGIEFLKYLQEIGAEIYLDTMRSGKELREAVKWCYDRDLIFDSIGPDPSQRKWTSSQKTHADYAIDDRSLYGLYISYDDNGTPFINWENLIPDFIDRIEKEGWIIPSNVQDL